MTKNERSEWFNNLETPRDKRREMIYAGLTFAGIVIMTSLAVWALISWGA